jgi:hypothetical protein
VVEVPGQRYFNRSWALNAGIRAATGRWVALLDADAVAAPMFAAAVVSQLTSFPDQVLVGEGGHGLIACRHQAMVQAGGLNEELEGWGHEDTDFLRRLVQGGRRWRYFPEGLLRLIPHGDEERVRFCREKDLHKSEQANMARLGRRLDRSRDRPWPDPVTFGLLGLSFEEVWRSVQYAHYFGRVHEGTVRLYPRWHGSPGMDFTAQPQADLTALVREMEAVLDVAAPLPFVTDFPPEQVTLPLNEWPYHFPGIPTRLRWRGWALEGPRRMAYQLDGCREGDCGNAPAQDLARLLGWAPGWELVRLGPPLSVRECVAAAAASDLFIGVDSGMAQLCYAVGVPVFLLGYGSNPWSLFQWHGNHSPIYCQDTDAFLVKVRHFLGTG